MSQTLPAQVLYQIVVPYALRAGAPTRSKPGKGALIKVVQEPGAPGRRVAKAIVVQVWTTPFGDSSGEDLALIASSPLLDPFNGESVWPASLKEAHNFDIVVAPWVAFAQAYLAVKLTAMTTNAAEDSGGSAKALDPEAVRDAVSVHVTVHVPVDEECISLDEALDVVSGVSASR